jgi:hypothetical protein
LPDSRGPKGLPGESHAVVQSSTCLRVAGFALVSLVWSGCSYPEFAFAEDSAARSDETSVIDTSVEDTTVAVDSSTADAIETAMVETSVAPDTAVVDTKPEVVVVPPKSCAEIKEASPTSASGAYTIDPDGSGPLTPFSVFCEMADDGGWTLALKLDGAETTFTYAAPLWTNDTLLKTDSTNLSENEAKFRSYLEMPFKQLRLRMVEFGIARAIVVDVAASSLKALFAGGKVVTTSGRAKWLSLLSAPSLQPNCNDEGINVDYSTATVGPKIRVRIGIVGNNESDCTSPDSFLGFGTTLSEFYCYGDVDPAVTTGNVAGERCGFAMNRATKAFGFIFIK